VYLSRKASYALLKMFVDPEDWHLGYSQIVTDCRASDGGVTGSALILCNADVDAMCAARILSYMFRSDGISYHLLPCMSYSQLRTTLERKKTDDVRCVVLLNMGASRNLTRLFKEEEKILDTSVKVFVMDFRRPVHLANVYAGRNVVVFWDNIDQRIPSDGENLSGNGSSSSSEDEDEDESSSDEEEEFDDDDDGEHEFGGDAGEDANREDSENRKQANNVDEDQDYDGDREDDPKSKKRRTERDDVGDDDDSVGSEGGENAGETDKSQQETQETTTKPTMTPRELYNDRRERLRLYYSGGTFHGSPAAYVAHRIATQLRFGDNGDLLWLACVGVTDAYLNGRLDVSGYAELAMNLRQNCIRLFPNNMYHRVESAAYAEHLTGNTGNQSGSATTQELTKIGFSGNGRIICDDDYRFFLLRHTSLYDAMLYSEFVQARLNLSTLRGKQMLQELLAKMGYPLEECNQPFAFMKPSLRRRLKEQMSLHAHEYGLDNYEFTSFFRVTGYQSLLSAADTSYAVTALLEFDQSTGRAASARNIDESECNQLQSFNHAFDALNSSDAPPVIFGGLSGEGSNLTSLVNGGNLSGNTGLGAGIRFAMVVQKSIVETATNLIERSAITLLKHFRYAYINCNSEGESKQGAAGGVIPAGEVTAEDQTLDHLFSKPLALNRLAHYLIDLHRVNRKWTGSKTRPLVLLAEKPCTKTYMVAAYEYADEAGHFVKNRFASNFELAAQSMQGTFEFDSFDSNVVEVSANDVQRFIEQLHYLMESM